ncbi:MAG: OmpA family protein [Opitutus sp.]
MKLASQKFFLVLAGTALLFAGCTKKPMRPDPGSTLLGPQGGGMGTGSSMPVDVSFNPEAPALTARLPDGVIDDGNTIRGLLQPVYFDFDRSEIKPGERAKLQAARDYLQANPGARLLLEGRCDWRGTEEYNLGLGDRRANSARRYTQSLGVAADRLETISKGSLEAVRNGDDATMSRDRRVELVIIKPRPPGAF